MTNSERFEMEPDSHDLYCVGLPRRHRVHSLYSAIYPSAEEQLGLFLRTPSTGITCLESLTTNGLFFPNYRVFCSCDDHRMIIVLVGQWIISRLMMTNYSSHVGYTSYCITNDCLKIHEDNAIKQCFSYDRLQAARKIILNTNHKMQLTI